jgi:hypothetical protein
MEIRTPPPHAHEGFPTRPNSLGLDPLLIELNVSQIYDNETPIELEIKVAKEAAN